MARVEFNPLDFGSILPEEMSAPDADLSQYLPEELPSTRTSRRQYAPVSTAVAKDLPPEARALLDTIATDESKDYNTIFGGQKFDDYSRHPGVYVPIKKGPNAGKRSSAAGRYQFLKSTWDEQAAKLGLIDFSPESQDRAAWNYAQEVYGNKTGRELLADLKTGDPRFRRGITEALSSVWTSMPGGIEQRSSADKFLNRYSESLASQGVAEPSMPEGETYDIPLSNGQIFTVPKHIDRREAINGLRAQGMDVEGVTEHALTNGQTLTIPESVHINDALADLKRQFPDQEWMTKAHAEKTGFLPAAGAAFKGVGAQFERGAGELLKSPELIAKGKAWQEELAKEVEAPLPTDPLSKKLAYYGGTALGGLAPLGAAVVAAPLLPEAAAMGALGAATVPIATGSLAQRYDEQGKPFDPYELQNIGAVGTEAVLQTLPFTKFAPVAGQVGKSLAKGAAGAAAADVPSVAIERAAAGQKLADEQALEEYAGTLAADILAGGTLGAVGGMRGRGARGPEAPPAGEEGLAPVTPAPEGPEGLAPTEGPVETVEDLEAQARAGEDFFRQAEAARTAEPAPEMVAPEAEIPEPTIRGEEQPLPTVEEMPVEAPVEAPAPSFADLDLKGKNSKVLMRSLNELDMENPEHGKTISELLDNAENVQHNPEVMQAIRTRLQEVQNAQQIPQAGAADGRGGTQPGFREEGRDQAVGGEGVEPSRQGIEAPEVKGKEEVKASEPYKEFNPEDYLPPELKAKVEAESRKPEALTREQKIEAQYQENKRQAVIRRQQAAEMSPEQLQQLRDAAVVENDRLDIEAIRKHFGEEQAASYADMNRRQREKWWEKNATEDLEDDSSVMKGIDENEIQEYIDAHANVFGDNARDLGRNVAMHLKGSEKPDWVNSPDYVAVKEAFKLADKEGWDRAEVIQGMRDRVRKYAGEDAPELFERLFKPATEKVPEAPAAPKTLKAQGVTPENAHSIETLNDHIRKTYGKDAPQVNVSTAAAEGVEPNVKGFYDPNTKKVTLIADNIGKGEDVHGLMRHEVAVHAQRLGKSDPEFQAILDRLQKLKDSGDASVARAYDRVPKDTTPEHIHEEALAYLSQHAPNLPIVKSFTSWMRRMAHKLTGNANWLKADDFGPMADEILRRKPEAAEAPRPRMYAKDVADEAVKNVGTETWFEKFYTPIRTQYASVRAPLEAILGKLPLYDEGNEIRATAKIAQQTRYAHIVSEGLHEGYLKRNAQGLVQVVFDPRLSPDRIISRVMELPEAVRDQFSEAMVTLAQAGHNLRGAEMKAVMDDAQRKIKLGQAYLDQTKSRYEKAKSKLDTLKSLSKEVRDNPRVVRELEAAQKEFDAAKLAYRDPNYSAGKDYIALQQRLYNAVKDQYSKAKRNEAGQIYDITPAQEKAARDFLNNTPEAKQLAADIRELLSNNAKLLRDTSVISEATYKKFTDSKYNYAPLYMSIEDLDAAMPASAVYLQGGQRKVMPVKGLKGGQHQIRFFENLLTHQARTGAMALHNNARLGSLESLVELGMAKELPGTTAPPKGVDVVAAIKDGKRRYYHVPDRPLYEAFEMVHNLPVPAYVTDATKYVSRAMLVNPKYWWNQLVREPFMATFTSRAGIITPFHTGKEFASLLFSELPNVDTSAAKLYRELKAQGVSGSHEYLRDLIQEKGKLEVPKSLTKNYKDTRDLVMRIHEYADAATKVAVMRKALERAESGQLTGKPLRGDAARDAAITHVGDMINFANRGRNATVQFITQTTPFFNSWAQGMDAIIRSATGYGMDPHAKGKTIAGLRTIFLGHAAAMMAFSAAITALRCEYSEDYRNAEPDEWSGNWLIPIPDSFETKEGRMVKAKGPFELNTLFKIGPEMWVRNWYGLDRDKDYTATIKSSIWRDIAPPGLERLFLPYVPVLIGEAISGYQAKEGSFVPLADTSLAPAERGKGQSPIADVVSAGILSPASVKHLGQGFFGGMYDMLDSTAKGAAAAFGSDTARADLRDITEKVPVISGMLTNPDHIELGQAYEFADKQAMARHTAKALKKRGEGEAAKEYADEGRYAKQAESIKRKISKTNTAIEKLKNTREYEDADALQRKYEQQLEKKRKQVSKLEALRSKAEEKE